jgi:Zn-finger protein
MANQCEHYPCHNDLPKDFSCEFCYCPEYENAKCTGTPKVILSSDGRTEIKDCSDCLTPHQSKYVTTYYLKKVKNAVST